MPEFGPGVTKTAKVPMTNPTTKAFDYLAALYMGTDLMVMAQEPFHLEASESKSIDLSVTMPSVPGNYPIHVGVSVAGENIALYKATEDVTISAPDVRVEIVRAYLREDYPSVSEAYSGWISLSVGGEINLGLFGSRIQAGVMLRNPTDAPLRYTSTIHNHHWTPEGYVDVYCVLPGVEPVRFLPAPTGMPYSSYEYECDKLLPPSGELAPGQTGFVYTQLYYQGRRWNYIYIQIMSNGYDLGTTKLYSGWYSY